MRIVHVTNYNFKYLGARHYTFPNKITNGFIRNGHDVFVFSDRDVARASTPFHSRKMGAKPCNRKLIEVCRNFKPEILALCHADVITAHTIAEIRNLLPGLAVFQYNIDNLANVGNIDKIQSKAAVVDHTFSTTAGSILAQISRRNAPASFIPNPVDPSIETGKCFEKSDQKNDVFFAGGVAHWAEQNDLRTLGPKAIQEQTDLICSFHGLGLGPYLWGQDYRDELTDSRIGLSLSHRHKGFNTGDGSPYYLYSSERSAQYFGNGLLVVSNKIFDMAELYGPESLVEVETVEEMIEKLVWLKKNDNERIKIARNGYEINHKNFNERQVSQFMIEKTLNIKNSYTYIWPIETY